jgi:hypothetical protein
LGKSSPDRREMEEMIRLVRHAGQALGRAEFDHARQQLMRLQHLAPKFKWVGGAIEQLRSLDETLTGLRAGPLGLPEGRGGTPLAETVALRGGARAQQPDFRLGAVEPGRASSNLPGRVLLLVDGGGSYLLLRGSRVSLGRAACSEPPDVPLFADLAERHAEIARVEDDYFLFSPNDVELDGRRTRHQLLKDNDRVVLGPKAKFTFRLPHRKSPSAIMELSDTTRMPSDVRRVILFSQTAMIGYGKTAHVQCQMAQSPLVLFERAGSLWLRPEGRGPAATEAVPVVMGNSVEVAGVRLVAKPWPGK